MNFGSSLGFFYCDNKSWHIAFRSHQSNICKLSLHYLWRCLCVFKDWECRVKKPEVGRKVSQKHFGFFPRSAVSLSCFIVTSAFYTSIFIIGRNNSQSKINNDIIKWEVLPRKTNRKSLYIVHIAWAEGNIC